MKRRFLYMLLFTGLLCFFMGSTSIGEEECEGNCQIALCLENYIGISDTDKSTLFHLPSSLTTIEDEAFEGTAITNVILSKNIETIGDYAFAYIRTLHNISIPSKTKYIGKNAFKGSTNVTITGAPRGYARTWSHENGIPFRPTTSFYAFNNTVQVNGGLTNSRAERLDVNSEQTEEEKPKPTGRMTGELNAEKKETITAFHIQSRSPPMA